MRASFSGRPLRRMLTPHLLRAVLLRGHTWRRAEGLELGAPFAHWRTGNQRSRMIIAGVLLSASAVALLARRLRDAGEASLAETIGIAVDANRNELLVGPNERHAIAAALHNCPAQLEPLRLALRAQT